LSLEIMLFEVEVRMGDAEEEEEDRCAEIELN
jgi:hypothetical protein